MSDEPREEQVDDAEVETHKKAPSLTHRGPQARHR